MKILHTSDWHLGQNFMFHDRKREHTLFLEWLIKQIREHRVDLLIIAGDIFDTGTPPNYAEELYFRFLAGVAGLEFCQVVVLGGNHDSVSALNASRRLLELVNTHVVASCSENTDDDIIVIRQNNLRDKNIYIPRDEQYGTGELVTQREYVSGCYQVAQVHKTLKEQPDNIDAKYQSHHPGNILGIICCVPFLRERDIRTSAAGESYDEKVNALTEGIREHYAKIYDAAVKKREDLLQHSYAKQEHKDNSALPFQTRIDNSCYIPIIATGHLFASGGISSDGVRDIYVGNLGHVGVDTMDKGFDYVALGHLHRAQLVGKREHIRYCGSPIALSFSESSREKQVIMVDFGHPDSGRSDIKIQPIPVPEFQKLRKIEGDLEKIKGAVADFEVESGFKNKSQTGRKWEKNEIVKENIWLEVKYTGEKSVSDLKNKIQELVEGRPFELFNIIDMNGVKRNARIKDKALPYLEELTENDIFARRLEAAGVPEYQMKELFSAFKEIMEDALSHTR